jgi:hypothetical protein
MEFLDIEFIAALGEVSFPLAFLIISYLALRTLAPIFKNSFDRQEDLFERIADTQDQISETLRGQAIMLHTLEQRVTRIENRLGSNTRSTDKG